MKESEAQLSTPGGASSPADRPSSFTSTLNPDAKEFRVPCGQTNDVFAALNPPVAFGGTPAVFVPIFAMPSTKSPAAGMMMPPAPAAAWQPSSGGGADFPFSPAVRTDVTKWPQVSAHRRTSLPRDSTTTAPPITAASFLPLTPRTVTQQIKSEYGELCQADGYHMTTVFNLEPRTTQEELLAIFFPMCAKKAELLPPHRSPRPNRRAGMVFFPSKDIAIMAVEKFNGFVPNKQHQPLTVLYCGPDAVSETVTREPSMLSVNSPQLMSSPHLRTPPPQQSRSRQEKKGLTSSQASGFASSVQRDCLHEEMWEFVKSMTSFPTGVNKHVLAVHGLDADNAHNVLVQNFMNRGAERCALWPNKTSPDPSSSTIQSKTVSGLVWFAQEVKAKEVKVWFQKHSAEGQTQPMDVVYLNSLPFAQDNFLVGNTAVQNNNNDNNNTHESSVKGQLATTTTATSNSPNMEIIDNIDAFFLREYYDPKLHLVAVHNLSANTEKKTLFSLFSPHGALDAEMYPGVVKFADESRCSGVAFFNNEAMARKAAEKLNSFVPFKQPNPLVVRYLMNPTSSRIMTPLNSGSSPGVSANATYVSTTSGGKLNELLVSVQEMLYTPLMDGDELMEKMLLIITHPDTTKETVGQLARVIVESLAAMVHHAVSLSTPLVNALMSLHERLNIPRNSTKDGNAEATARDPVLTKYISYMQLIAHVVINLFMDKTKPHEARKVAAVLSAYLFQFSYLVKTPYELSVLLIDKNEDSLNKAREYMIRRQMNTKHTAFISPEGEEEEKEHKPWLTLMECLEQLTLLWRQNNKSRAKKDPFRKEYEQRANDFSQGCTSRGGGSGSLNTSTRPTPRRVVAKVTPKTGSVVESSSSPGLTHSSPVPSRLNLRGFGENGNLSHDVSRESNGSPVVIAPVFSTLDSSASSAAATAATRTHGNAFMSVSQPPQYHLQSQQKIPHTMQRRDLPTTRGRLSEGIFVADSMKPSFGMRTNGGSPQSVYTQQELMERTVYITKLPSSLRRAQFRRLLLHFGEFNKVRLCRDENQFQMKNENSVFTPTTNSALPTAAVTQASSESSVSLFFSFVEFAEPSSAKAMIEYFRNVVTNQQPFSFLLDNSGVWPESSYFTPANIQLLMKTRASPARNPIHDQLPLDAVLVLTPSFRSHVLRNRPCLFGIDDYEKTLDVVVDTTASPPASSSCVEPTGSGGRKFVGPRASLLEPPQLTLSSTAPHQTDRLHCDPSEDMMDLSAIMRAVVPTVPLSTWAAEPEVMPSHDGIVFTPIQDSWLTNVAGTTHGTDQLTDMTFADEKNTTTTNVTSTVAATDFTHYSDYEADSKDLWSSCIPLYSNHFIDNESDADDDDEVVGIPI